MAKLPKDWMARSRPVPTREELDNLPGAEGEWWRAWHARMAAAHAELDAEYGPGAGEQAMLSVFPQPAGAWEDIGEDPDE